MTHRLIAVAGEFYTSTRQAIAMHPGRVTSVVAAILLGAGGFAVASLAPDASTVQVYQLVEPVPSLPLQTQVDVLADLALRLYRSDVTRSSDSAESLLKRLGIDDPEAASHLRSNALARQALLGHAGRNVRVEASDNGNLLRLSARWSPKDDGTFKRLVMEKTDQGFDSRLETAPLTASTRLVSGTIQSSLFAATDDARIPDAVAIQVAEIFSGDIDFHRDLRKADQFSIVYETLEGDGEPLRSGRVLSTEFINKGKTFQALWFQEPPSTAAPDQARNKGGYYTLDGQSLRRAFLASPMEFSRITSGMKMRFHPILQKWRAHNGVDYAAPSGTPIRTVGDGVVSFAGVQNGYGKVVHVSHRNQITTVYAHMSRINVRRGQSISQGQMIGAVGSTGWSTGPHLHFEYRVNGAYKDPRALAKNNETTPVSAAARKAFDREAMLAKTQLAAAATVSEFSIE